MNSNGPYAAIADLTAPFSVPSSVELDDTALIEAQRSLAEIRRRVDAAAAAVAGEIEHRSRRELGYDGLTQRLGARTPQKLIQLVTGVSSREANVLVRVGGLEATSPWLRAVTSGVAAGHVSVEAADVIRGALGSPDDSVSESSLNEAATTLVHEMPGLTLERLAARARELRTELDLDHVRDREGQLREHRYLRLAPQMDGMTRISGLLDPESAATVVAAFDAATSPRRGGPRFVDKDAEAWAQRLVDDERTTDQVALDAFVDLIRLGTAADDGRVLGSRKPTVRILVTKAELDLGRGAGHIEGQSVPVSIETVKRRACSDGVVPIRFDGKKAMDLGRAERFYLPRQNTLIAARDGGCIAPGCDRPPSWAETHHINEWQHGGKTDVADGVLLCRHHHLWLHNNGWRCIRRGDDYFFIPPVSIDPSRTPIPAQDRSRAFQSLIASEAGPTRGASMGTETV